MEDLLGGWYELEGVAYVTPAIADDPEHLGEVRNHELAHHVLTRLSPHGLAASALRSARRLHPDADQLLALVADASRLTQEAVATYSSLAIASPARREASIAGLSPMYRQGYELLAGALDHRGLDDVERLRASRVLGARALQTAIVDDWVEYDLGDLGNLSSYLAEPDHHPDQRLGRLVDGIHDLSDTELYDWAGSIDWGSGIDARLVPAVPTTRFGLEFHALPEIATRVEVVKQIMRTLASGDPDTPDRDNGDNGDDVDMLVSSWLADMGENFRTALLPAMGGMFDYDLDGLPHDWVENADFVHVELADFENIVIERTTPPIELEAGKVMVELRRPDYEAGAAVYLEPELAAEIVAGLASVGATICFGQTTIVPIMVALEGSEMAQRWRMLADAARLTVCSFYNPGDAVQSVVEPLLVFDSLLGGTHWCYHAVAGTTGSGDQATTWGTIVIRPEEGRWPQIFAPVLMDEWDRFRDGLDRLLDSGPVRWEPDPATFFVNEHDVVAFYRFVRAFIRMQQPVERWRQLEPLATAALLGRTGNIGTTEG